MGYGGKEGEGGGRDPACFLSKDPLSAAFKPCLQLGFQIYQNRMDLLITMSFIQPGLDRVSISKSVFDSLYFLWRTIQRLLLLSLKMTAKPGSGSMANTITGKTNLQKLTGRRGALQCFKYTISLSFVLGNTVQLAKLICKT